MSRNVRLLLLGVIVCGGAGVRTALAQTNHVAPADPQLQRAYLSLHFRDLYPTEAVQHIQGKLQHAPRAAAVLADVARDERAEVRVLVALLLGPLGEAEGADTLWALLCDKSESVRLTASGSLILLHGTTPVPRMPDGLKDERPEVRRFTVATLGRLGKKVSEAALVKTLQDPDEMVRMEATRALSPCGTRNAVPAVVELLHDKSVLVRTAAVSTLGVLGAVEAVDALTQALGDPDWHVRATVVSVLGQFCQHPVDGARVGEAVVGRLQLDDFALVRDRAADVLRCRRDEKAVAALVQAFLSDDCEVRIHATQTLCQARLTAALPLLMEQIHHPNAQVREKIIEVFGAIGSREQLPAVAEAMSDPEMNVRLAAVNALQGLRERGGTELVMVKLGDGDAHVRAAAVRIIGNMGDKSLSPRLLPLLRDDSSYVRSAAAEALGRLGDRAAVKPLMELLAGLPIEKKNLENNDVVVGMTNQFFLGLYHMGGPVRKINAVQLLGQMRATEAVDAIVTNGLQAEDSLLRAVSAYSLGQIRDPRAVGPLQKTVKPYYDTLAALPPDWDAGNNLIDPGIKLASDNDRLRRENEARVRASVAWALGQIADLSSLEILQRAANDQNSLVRDSAQEAIQKILEKQERLTVAGAPRDGAKP